MSSNTERVIEIIDEYALYPPKLGDELGAVLGLDDVAKLIVLYESLEAFEIHDGDFEATEREALAWQTVADVIAFVDGRVG